jgi:hypothetical protein
MTQYSGFLFAVVGNVQLYYWQPQQNPQWQWHDLGMPNGVVSAECPLALSHYNGETARTEINLFISGWDTASNEWHLFERHWNGMDIDQWDEWHDHGKPPDVNVPSNTTVGRPLVGPDDGGFQMTASLVWFDGSGALRINIFGSTHPFTDIEGNLDGAGNQIVQGGQLLEYQWDGAVWSWASATEDLAYCNERQVVAGGAHSGARVPVPLVITSAAVVTRAPRVHISVFGSSLRGTIWERFWDSWSTPNPQWALH